VAAARNVRSLANGLFVVAVVLFVAAMYVGLVFWENTIDLGAGGLSRVDLFTWFLLFIIPLLLVLVALLVLYFRPAVAAGRDALDLEETTAVEWEAMQAPPPQAAAETAPIVDADAEALVIRCSNCSRDFDLPYTTERPLTGACPHCGEEFVLEEGEEVLSATGQPVIDLEGIGPQFARKLAAAGITTTEQLRIASAERLARQTGISTNLLRTWQAMADFIRLRGIGKQHAEVLARAGVKGVEELARETPQHLASRVKAYLQSLDAPPMKSGVDAKRARRWIEAARKMDLDEGL
jgi:predicted flap endonuclease-1-like 5' DNA nuclease/DNA-directed RNA polymerase subunit RPC12/RpoP/uncharacterized membrane protein